MILKEAYRYQNYLSLLMNGVTGYLGTPKNVTIITQEHMRSKAHQDAIDETVTSLAERTIKRSVSEVIGFGLAVLDEKAALAKAIDTAKGIFASSVDRDISINRSRYSLIQTLKGLVSLKPKERMSYGTAYCFNAEGNQSPYRYDIKETVSLDFDRDQIRQLINELSKISDEAANHADYCLNTVEVGFEPRFNINDSFEDALEAFYATTDEEAAN